MSNNCLVTKFKGSVDNDNLPIYGKFVMEVPIGYQGNTTNFGMFFDGTTPVTLQVTGTVSVWGNSSKTTRFDHDGILEVASNPCVFYVEGGAEGGTIIGDKYGINSIGFGDFKPKHDTLHSIAAWFDNDTFGEERVAGFLGENVTEVFKDYTNIVKFEASTTYRGSQISEIYGTLNDLVNSKSTIQSVSCYRTHINGDISNIAGPNLAYLDAYICDVVGDIAALGPCTSLSYFNVYGTQVGGSIENLVLGQIAAGKTSGSINHGACHNTNITFKGVACAGGNGNLTWTSNGSTATITFLGDTETIPLT